MDQTNCIVPKLPMTMRTGKAYRYRESHDSFFKNVRLTWPKYHWFMIDVPANNIKLKYMIYRMPGTTESKATAVSVAALS